MTPADATRRNPRPRIDWIAARQLYLDLEGERTFAAVAKHFGVSDVAVGNRARREDWKRAAREYDERTADELAAKRVRTRAARVAQSLRIVDKLLDRVEVDVDVLDLKVSDFPALVKTAELLEGQATDRIALGEIQPVLRTYNAALLELARFAPDDIVEALMGRLDTSLAEIQRMAESAA